jgi:hypothetical protein
MLDEEAEFSIKSACHRAGLTKEQTARWIAWATDTVINHALLGNIKLGFVDVTPFQDGEPAFSISQRGMEYAETHLLKRRLTPPPLPDQEARPTEPRQGD